MCVARLRDHLGVERDGDGVAACADASAAVAEEGGGGRRVGAEVAAVRDPRGPRAPAARRPRGLPPAAHRRAGRGRAPRGGAGDWKNRRRRDASLR